MTHPATDLHHADGRFYLGDEEITAERFAKIDADWVDQQIERAMAERVGRSAELGSVV